MTWSLETSQVSKARPFDKLRAGAGAPGWSGRLGRWPGHDAGDEVEEDGAKKIEDDHKEHYLESFAEGPHAGGGVLNRDDLRG
jgi:hypothetical protein